MKWFKSLHSWCNHHEWLIFLIILVLVLRLPSFIMPHHYGDEEIYFVMGRAWSEGVPLYKAMFDHKPPLIYVMAGIAPTMLAFRGLLAAVMVLHTVLFWNLAKLIWAKTRIKLAYLSSLLFVLITTLPAFEGLTVNAELLMMVPVTAAVLILWNAKLNEWKKYFFAGLLGGLAWLFKIPVAADMVAIGLFFLVFKQSSFVSGLKAIFSKSFLAYLLAFVAPLALTFGYYYLIGSGSEYLATVLTVNFGYISSWSTSSYEFNPLKSGLLVRVIYLAVFTVGLYLTRKKIDRSLVFVALWFGFSLFGALLSGRPYPHYLLQPAVPAAMLVPFIFVVEDIVSWVLLGVVAGVSILVQSQIKFWMYPTLKVYTTYFEYVTKKITWPEYLDRFDNAPRNYEVAKYLNERLTDEDHIYVWGSDSTIYNLTNKLPSGGKYIVSFHVHDLRQYDYTIENLKSNEPLYIILLPGAGEFSDLATLIDHRYILVEEIRDILIYMRLP